MKPRITTGGRIVKAATNGESKNGKKYCHFCIQVAVKTGEDILLDCFLPYHPDEKQQQALSKGSFVMLRGRYGEAINTSGEKTFFNRTLNVNDFVVSDRESPFFDGLRIDFVGTVADYPVSRQGQTLFPVEDKNMDGTGHRRLFSCQIPRELTASQLKEFQKGTFIYLQGRYADYMVTNHHGSHIERYIGVRDYRILEQPRISITIEPPK